MPSSVSTSLPERAATAPGLSWTHHPARRSPVRSLLAVATIAATGLFAASVAASTLAGVLSVALLVFSLRWYFFPVRTVVDQQGVAMRCLGLETRRRWERIQRFRYDEHGAFLSTRMRPGILDALTGLHLTWNRNCDEAVALIERHLPPNGRRS